MRTETFQNVWFGGQGSNHVLVIQLNPNARAVPVSIRGKLSFINYPIGKQTGLYHLVDNASGVVRSTNDPEAFIAFLGNQDGPVDYYMTCMCGPGIGSLQTKGAEKILSFIHKNGRAGQFYLIGCCGGGVGQAMAKEWSKGLLRRLELE